MIKIITGHIPADKMPAYGCAPYGILMFPENGTHPSKYFKETELTIKNWEENVTIFTYSPAIINCFDVLSEDLEVEIKFIFYTEDGDKKIIPQDELYIIYDDLGGVYDEIDLLLLKIKRWGKRKEREKSCCKVEL